MKGEKVNNNKAQKRFEHVRTGVEYILSALYKLSVKMFLETQRRFNEFKAKEGLDKETLICPEESKRIVEEIFREKYHEIDGTSLDIGRKVVRDYGLSVALEAWIFSRRHILKNKGQLNGIPIVWRGTDEYFKRFLPPNQLEELTKMDEEADNEPETAAEIVAGTTPKLDLSGSGGEEEKEPGVSVPGEGEVGEAESDPPPEGRGTEPPADD
jgi:hypothetical protein